MDKNQILQLRVLLKTKINQLNNKLQQSPVNIEDESNFRDELLALKSNLQCLDSGEIGSCRQCGQDINYLYLITHPHTELCENCDQ